MDVTKPLKDWTLTEVVLYNTGNEILAIGEGTFSQAVFRSANLVLQWKFDRDEAEAKAIKKGELDDN
jgi:phosphoheptose isomerase